MRIGTARVLCAAVGMLLGSACSSETERAGARPSVLGGDVASTTTAGAGDSGVGDGVGRPGATSTSPRGVHDNSAVQPSSSPNATPGTTFATFTDRKRISQERALAWFTARPVLRSYDARVPQSVSFWAWSTAGGDSDEMSDARLLEILHEPEGAEPESHGLGAILGRGGLLVRVAIFRAGSGGWAPGPKSKPVRVRGRSAFVDYGTDGQPVRFITWTQTDLEGNTLWYQILTGPDAVSEERAIEIVDKLDEIG